MNRLNPETLINQLFRGFEKSQMAPNPSSLGFGIGIPAGWARECLNETVRAAGVVC